MTTNNPGGDDDRRAYPCALTDAMWQQIQPHLPVRDPSRGGRPRRYDHRLIIDSILYVLASGCAWRLVPNDLAPWHAAYRWFRHWSAQGVWDDIHELLRDAVRRAEGRDPQPTAAVLDSQSAKSACGGEQIGYDAGKRVRGRKRHLLVDTIGLVWADGGYANSVDVGLVGWADQYLGVKLEIVKRNDAVKGFQVLPRRWVVERTPCWLAHCRRLCRDYERTIAHAEDLVKIAMIRLMAARLAGQQTRYHDIRPIPA